MVTHRQSCKLIRWAHAIRVASSRTLREFTTVGAGMLLLTALGTPGTAVADDVEEIYRSSTEKYIEQLDGLAERCVTRDQPQGADAVRRWVVRRDPRRQYFFTLADVPPSPRVPAADEAAARPWDWRTEFAKLRDQRAKELFRSATAALNSGNSSRAYGLVFEALHEDPQHVAARKILGYQEVDGDWSTPFSARMIAQGKIDHPEFGWLPKKHVRRYEAGQRRYRGRWVSAEAEDRLRGRMTNGWRIETDHYEVHTNYSLAAGVDLGRKLESLYAAWRQAFVRFYATNEQLARRFRGETVPLTPARKLKVVFFRNRREYVEYLQKFQPKIDLTLGLYLSRQQTAFFYAGDDAGDATLYHEATHQLFHEVGIAGRRAPHDIGSQHNFWIVEGIALLMESLEQHDGYVTLGGIDAARLQYARQNALDGGFRIPFEQLTSLSQEQLQSDDRIRLLYGQAAGMTHFLMQYGRGCYRMALTDYLKTVYWKRDEPDTLATLTGQPLAQLDEEYREYLNVHDQDLACLEQPLRGERLLLGQTEITDRGLGFLAGATSLKELGLADTKISDEALKVIGQFRKLQELDLSGTDITNGGLRHLRDLRQLRVLSLSATAIDDRGLTHLTNFAKLEEFHVDGTRVTSSGLQTLRQSIPSLH